MKRLNLCIVWLLFPILGFAQMPGWSTPEQQALFSEAQTLYDSLAPMQKEMFLIEIKHIMEPEVEIIKPGLTDNDPPADAIILFDGTDINKEWQESNFGARGAEPKVKPEVSWVVKDGAMESGQRSGSIATKRSFEDFQLHIEWKTPSVVTGDGQDRGNSGIIIQGIYELQILDSYNNRTYKNGQAGAVYMQYAPLVNVSRKPGEWQTFDIFYTAPRFKDSTTYLTPPRITVVHNGVLIQNNVSIQGPTVSSGIPQYKVNEHGPGPISLQQHGNPVAFRNVWIREL